MYPASLAISNNSGSSQTYQYTYNSDNNLTKYGTPGSYEIAVDPHTVTQSSFTSASDVINTYAYSGPSNSPVDIYTNTPAQMSISTVSKNVSTGTSTTTPGKSWAFRGNSNTITQMSTADQGGETIDFTYDANANLKTITWTNLSGQQAGIPFASLTVTAVDNKPSPFSAVKAYNVISYPQYYAPDFAFGFCKNNPSQMVYKQFDDSKGDLEPTEQDDFTYTYNAQGYPTAIAIKITYFGFPNIYATRNYTITYK